MANEQNLKPFKKGDDPRRNTSGANSSSITKYLKELGDSKQLSYNIVVTNTNGVKKELKGKIAGRGRNGTINHIIASQLMTKAVKGDLRAIQEVLDRTEGKPKQGLGIDFDPNDDIRVGYDDDE